MNHHSPNQPEAPQDEIPATGITEDDGGHVTNRNEDIFVELAILRETCVQQTLPHYLAGVQASHPTPEEVINMVKKLIRGREISPENLTFLREHISPFIDYTKRFPRQLTIPAGEGIGEAGKKFRAAIRRVVGKIDALNWLNQALKDRVAGFNFEDLLTRRITDIETFLRDFGLNETECAKAMEDLKDKMRNLCHDMVQNNYTAFRKMVENMKTLEVTSLGIDFSDVVVKNWHPNKEELATLLWHDLNDRPTFSTVQWDKEKFLDSVVSEEADAQLIRNVIMLAAMRKNGFGPEVMKPISTEAIVGLNASGHQRSSEAFLYNKTRSGNAEKPINSPQGMARMTTFSEWATNAVARKARGQELPDHMSATDPINIPNLWMPSFDDRVIIPLSTTVFKK